MNTVRNDLNMFNKTVSNLTEKVSKLEENQNQLSSKMDQMTSTLATLKTYVLSNTQQLTQLHNEIDPLNLKLVSVNALIGERERANLVLGLDDFSIYK